MSVVSMGVIGLGGLGTAGYAVYDTVQSHSETMSQRQITAESERNKAKIKKYEDIGGNEAKIGKYKRKNEILDEKLTAKIVRKANKLKHLQALDIKRRRRLLSSYVVTRACHKYTEDLEKRLLRQL